VQMHALAKGEPVPDLADDETVRKLVETYGA
jgi:hypothetical protein